MIHYNIPTDGVAATAAAIGGKTRGHATISIVYTRPGNGAWQFHMGRCVLKRDDRTEREEIYRDCAFVVRAIPDFSLKDFLAALDGDGYRVSDGFPPIALAGKNAPWRRHLIPGHATQGFPLLRFGATIPSQSFFGERQLFAFGMPFRASALQHLSECMGWSQSSLPSDGSQHEFSIEIEDRRGKIDLSGNRLSIAESSEELCLVGQINDDVVVSLRNGESLLLNGGDVKSVELWLLTQQNEIVDHWSSSEYAHAYPPRSGNAQSQDETLKGAILRGEGEECEFKPYIDLTDSSNAKSLELEKAVCAFSNHRGGCLFVGVDDEAEVVGIDRQVERDYRCSVDEATASYEKAIRKRLSENLKDGSCFKTEVVTVYGKLIVMIRVEPSQQLNFLLNSSQAYMRRGASSVKMSPADIELRFRAASNSPARERSFIFDLPRGFVQ
jgi:hypothetical protein